MNGQKDAKFVILTRKFTKIIVILARKFTKIVGFTTIGIIPHDFSSRGNWLHVAWVG
jgi:hypothetical protein